MRPSPEEHQKTVRLYAWINSVSHPQGPRVDSEKTIHLACLHSLHLRSRQSAIHRIASFLRLAGTNESRAICSVFSDLPLFQRKQVSRLGLILLAHLPTGRGAKRKSALLRPRPQWHPRAFVRFTVTGIARKSHPRSHGGKGGRWQPRPPLPSRIAAQIHRLFICRFDYTMRNRERQGTGFSLTAERSLL